ncbi:MAG: hypothetical protein FJ292_03355 [Planctomycetes bacterium]|nr:hypothetical protein [Planctomycetota bacterium]
MAAFSVAVPLVTAAMAAATAGRFVADAEAGVAAGPPGTRGAVPTEPEDTAGFTGPFSSLVLPDPSFDVRGATIFDLPWLALPGPVGARACGPIHANAVLTSVRVLFVPESLRLVNWMFGTFSGTHPHCSLVMQNIFDPGTGRFSDTFPERRKRL